jgi:O-antigen ligase
MLMNLLADWYTGHWIIFIWIMLILIGFLSFRMGRFSEYSISFCIFNGAFVGFYGYPDAHSSVSALVKLAALQGVAQMSLLLIAFIFWSEKFNQVLRVVFWINIVMTYLCWIFPLGFTGIGLNTSLNGTLLALLLGYEIGHHETRKSLLIAFITIGAVILTKTSMGLIAIIFGMGISLVAVKKLTFFRAISICSLMFFIGFLFYGNKIWSLSYREVMWKMMFQYMIEQNTWLIGSGFGTFSYLGPKIQDTLNWTHTGYFVQAHSDIIQMFFECGIIGFLIWATLILKCFIRGIRNISVSETYFFSAFAISCVGNFPFRLPLTALCLIGMLKQSEKIDKISDGCKD